MTKIGCGFVERISQCIILIYWLQNGRSAGKVKVNVK